MWQPWSRTTHRQKSSKNLCTITTMNDGTLAITFDNQYLNK
nr:MAG TPA: hypothetical protein [Caudoviricetes sp.]